MGANRQVAFLFGEGSHKGKTVADLGGKGDGLDELTRLGVPVPPGFTITTSVARAFAQHRCTPARLTGQLQRGIASLQRMTNKTFGGRHQPLLVSVRSGAPVSMPGMMDTVLNLGMNEDVVHGLADMISPTFAWDVYSRFLSMFGSIVLGLPREWFAEMRPANGDANQLEALCRSYIELIKLLTGLDVPTDPWQQLDMATMAVLRSWNSERAVAYRKAHRISEHLGTAVTIQSMVFGNLGQTSGTGVVFSHNCKTGDVGLWGSFLINAQGEDVVAGTSSTLPIEEMANWNRQLHDELNDKVMMLAERRKVPVDIEFTVEALPEPKLYILQVRAAKLAPQAAAVLATRAVWAGTMSKDEAAQQLTEDQIHQLTRPEFLPEAVVKAESEGRLLAQGESASPGTAIGEIVRTSEEAVKSAAAGKKVILVRRDTSPEDLPGMLVAEAIVTMIGGLGSHAAVVARGLGKPAVVGCNDEGGLFSGSALTGIISLDGTSGKVFKGEIEADSDANKRKEVNIFLKWATTRLWPKQRLAFEYFDKPSNLKQLLADFYLCEHMALAATGTSLRQKTLALRRRIHIEIAERFALYLAVAIGGEIRHARSKTSTPRKHDIEVDELVATYGIELGGDRGQVQTKTIGLLQKMNLQQQIRFCELCMTVFNGEVWSGSYGGPKWGAIAKALHLFLSGDEKFNHSVFADHTYDLRHNSGPVFNKRRTMIEDFSDLPSLLDAKKNASGVLDLVARLLKVLKSSSYVAAQIAVNDADALPMSPDVKQLFVDGFAQGIWAAQLNKPKSAAA